MAESIEGLCNSCISYKLKATVTRGGLGSAFCAYKPVRVVQAMSLAALNRTGPIRQEGIWPDKIEYQFCIPQRAIVFGTALTIHMCFTTLLKGLRIGTITCVLVKSQEFNMPGSPPGRSFKRTRTVEQWIFEMTRQDEYIL